MPASRSRTERWRDCLRQVHERDGALEVSVSGPSTGNADADADLVWRVRILSLRDDAIIVEQPSAAGAWINLQAGIRLIAVMAIGQNRWMFRTQVIGEPDRVRHIIRLAMPETVERCQRRNFFRVTTAELSLPTVECWPLLDPTTVVAAEVANRTQILDLLSSPGSSVFKPTSEPVLLPEVGPKFQAKLMNFGGGGAGLIIAPNEAAAIDRARLYWLRVHLTPHLPVPLGMTGRLVHTHIDSTQSVYAGIAFEWAFHPAHRDFVIQQITRCIHAIQAAQLSAQAA